MEKLSQNHTLYRATKHKPSGWTKRDDLKGEIVQTHGITDDSLLTTRLNAYSNRYLKDLNNVHARLGKELKRFMMPWDDRGFGIVHNSRIPEMEKLVSDAKIEADLKLDIFLQHYSDHIEEMKGTMGTAFREADYDSVEKIRSKHSIEIDIAIVPDPEDDARAGWTTDMRERYARQLRKQEDEKVSRATRELAKRIDVSITKVVDRMKGYTGKQLGSFNDTLIQNVRDMASMIPEFNLTNDPTVDAVYQKIVRDICTLDVEDLREDETLRKKVVASGEDILERVGTFGRKKND